MYIKWPRERMQGVKNIKKKKKTEKETQVCFSLFTTGNIKEYEKVASSEEDGKLFQGGGLS